MERQREKEEKEAKKRQRLKEKFADLMYSIKVTVILMLIFHSFLYLFCSNKYR
jgi:hypothetical protein